MMGVGRCCGYAGGGGYDDDDAGWGSSYQDVGNAIFAGKSEWISRSKTRVRVTLFLEIPCGDGAE
jgi:hypothetical protein